MVTVANTTCCPVRVSVRRHGWKVGMLLPRHLGEAQWLMWDDAPGDKILVSGNRSGFTSVIVRNGEPVLVRTCVCDRQSQADELHRFALYYRDRLNPGGGAVLSRILATGGIDMIEARRAVADATDSEPLAIDAAEFGVDLAGEAIRCHWRALRACTLACGYGRFGLSDGLVQLFFVLGLPSRRDGRGGGDRISGEHNKRQRELESFLYSPPPINHRTLPGGQALSPPASIVEARPRTPRETDHESTHSRDSGWLCEGRIDYPRPWLVP